MKVINSLPNSFRWLVGVTGLTIIGFASVIMLVRDANLRMVLIDIINPVRGILLTSLLFFTARLTASVKPSQAVSWRLWAFAFVFYTLGDFCWAILEVILGVAPFPSLADLFYFLSYVFLWLGLVRYPADNFSRRERSLTGLDNLIVALGAGLAYWVFLINPMLRASGEVDFFSLLLAVVYPILDLVFLWTLLIFFRNRLQQSVYIPLVLIGVCLLIQIIADSLFAYQSVNVNFLSGSTIQLVWGTGAIFMVCAIIAQVNSVVAEKGQPQTTRWSNAFNSWPLYLPYIWLAISYSILIANASMDGGSLPLYLVVGFIIALVIFRQALTLNENERLFNQVEADMAEREQAQEALRLINLELDTRVQERTQDLFVANQQALQANRQLQESLREKETLLKEVHHRVKNNLQIISSLLNLQVNQVQEASAARALRDSQARVRSMALIHEKLYQSESLAKINFGEYIQNLTNDLFRSYQRGLGSIQLKIQADSILLDLDQAVPCGLILNELITNVLKYAFPDGRNGTIWVELRGNSGQMVGLWVADDGVGFPANLDIRKTKSLGWQLINSLVAQVDGLLEVESSAGTSIRISFSS